MYLLTLYRAVCSVCSLMKITLSQDLGTQRALLAHSYTHIHRHAHTLHKLPVFISAHTHAHTLHKLPVFISAHTHAHTLHKLPVFISV